MGKPPPQQGPWLGGPALPWGSLAAALGRHPELCNIPPRGAFVGDYVLGQRSCSLLCLPNPPQLCKHAEPGAGGLSPLPPRDATRIWVPAAAPFLPFGGRAPRSSDALGRAPAGSNPRAPPGPAWCRAAASPRHVSEGC